MQKLKIAISGCGIAGPTLAYWLLRAGHEPVIIESAPRLRAGGYIVDFWGVGYEIADKMGLVPKLRDIGYDVREVRFVDKLGRKTASLRTEVFGRITADRFTSLRRSDLSGVLFSAVSNDVESMFGNSLVSVDEDGTSLALSFQAGPSRRFDLLIGADGLHSKTRQLVFGPKKAFEVNLGYYVAAFEANGYRPRDELVYVSHSLPGRQISRFSLRDGATLFLFIFRQEQLASAAPLTTDECKTALRQVFGQDAWECASILDLMISAEDIYFDRVSQIKMASWTKGRVALVGDAAACVSLLAGEGTGLAMAEAFVLAGELSRSGGVYAAGFTSYESRLRNFLAGKQKSAEKFASIFAPRSALGLFVRDATIRLLRFSALADYFVGRDLRDDLILPNYEWRFGK